MDKIIKKIGVYAPIFLPLVMVAGIAYVVYLLYEQFFGSSASTTAANAAATAGVADLTTVPAIAAASLTQLTAQLRAQGQTTDVDSQGNANTLHTMMDCSSVDHTGLVNFILELNITDFQLAAISYGQQELRNYQDSLTHIFTTTFWEDSFSTLKCYGSLKFHLMTVLSSDELSSISAYTDTIP